MNPDKSPAQDKPADEYTGNYGRGGYYGYTYNQEIYNRQVKQASQAEKIGHPQDPVHKNKPVSAMAKYSKGAQKKVERAMHEKKRGQLKSGRSGKTVKSRKQAIAIGLSEARKAGARVPAKKGARKSAAKKTAKKSPKKSAKKSSKRGR
jgi:hypothetical protein